MAHLPTDILSHQIFLKLPTESLLPCKCVCKAWNRVICDPEFVRMHHLLNQHDHPKEKLLFATSTVKGLYYRNFYSLDYEASKGTNVADAVKLNLNFPAEVDATEILGSSNGLLCMAARYRKRRYSNGDDDILICNPSTGDSMLIRDTLAPRSSNICAAPPLVGFAYDSSINDGKFVRITNFSCEEPGRRIKSRVDMYSIKSNSWNIVKYGAPVFGVCAHRRGCVVNGSIYWPVDYQSAFRIMAFRLRDNKIRNMQLPRNCKPRYHTYLMALGGTLGIFQLPVAECVVNRRLVVWTMKKNRKGEWIKLVHIDDSYLRFGHTEFLGPVCLMRTGKILMPFNEQYWKRSRSQNVKKFVLYDAGGNNEYFCIRGISRRHNFNVVTYVESFLSPNSIARGA